MRITKDPEERKAEIMDAAEELFSQKGFEATAVSDIVKKVGVAQGLFYYYFKSKDEVLSAVVERLTGSFLRKINTIYTDPKMKAVQKLNKILFESANIGKGKESFIRLIHQEEFEPLHQRFSICVYEKLTPILLDLVRQGIDEGVFKLEYPEETVEFFLAGIDHYFNKAVRFYYGRPEFREKIRVIMGLVEKVLGADAGTFEMSNFKPGE